MDIKEIRLLHLIKTLDMGGIEKSTILYSNYLQEKLDFIGIYASKGFYDNSKLLNTKIKRYYPPKEVWEKRFFLKTLKHLFFVIRDEQITHLHYHHRIYIPYIFFIKQRFPKLKIIYTHHSYFNDFISHLIIADIIITLNKITEADLPKRFHSKLKLIPHGVIIPTSNGNSSQTIDKIRNIGYVGRFDKSKGILELLDAFKKALKIKPKLKLILVGNGPLLNQILIMKKKINLDNKIIIKNPHTLEEEVYSEIDLLIMPSKNLEGFGLSVVEAMARHIPVIVSDIPALREIVKNNFNGLVFQNDLEKKIISLVQNVSLYNKLQDRAYLTVSDNYNISKTVKSYFNKVYI